MIGHYDLKLKTKLTGNIIIDFVVKLNRYSFLVLFTGHRLPTVVRFLCDVMSPNPFLFRLLFY